MAGTLEVSLFVNDPLNPRIGGSVEFTKSGEVVLTHVLTYPQYHYLLGVIAREASDLVNGEAGR
jgi:hypothetical protein